MGVIRVLPAEIAGRIAAGEVIERPASVIKELVENSIDAGASRVRVLTEQGGQKLMQVIDDGRGMDRQDAMLCLEAHATSKIQEDGDVGQIRTLGFRGEALPSISSVSRFELQTRQAGQDSGTEVVVDNGVIQDIRECGCAPGTSVKVQWLFGNLPARRKFLKGAATEDDYIHEMMLMLALTRPGVSFELFQNGRCVLRSPATAEIGSRVEMLVGKDAFEAMIPVEHSEDGISVRGFISKPGFTRSNRREQRIVVNGRAATSETIYFAIRDAYESLVVKGRYPGVVLYVDVAADRVDVNVHPTKREVRFRDPMRVSTVVGAALRNALRGIAAMRLDLETSGAPSAGGAPPVAPGVVELVDTTPAPSSAAAPAGSDAPPPGSTVTRMVAPAPPVVPRPPAVQQPLPFGADAPAVAPSTTPGNAFPQASPSAVPSPGGLSIRLISSLGSDYLLAESGGGIVVVSIKSATQRILFERFLANLKMREVPRQPLLIPVTLHLSPDESRLLSRELPFFQSIGYMLEEFGAHTYLVTAVPQNIPDRELENTIRDILSDLRQESVTNRQSAVHLAQLASRHAVWKRGELSPEEQRQLIESLMHCEMPYADPAGLPTMLHITYSELNQRFKS